MASTYSAFTPSQSVKGTIFCVYALGNIPHAARGAADGGVSAGAGGVELTRAVRLRPDGEAVARRNAYALLRRECCVVDEDEVDIAGDSDTRGDVGVGTDVISTACERGAEGV